MQHLRRCLELARQARAGRQRAVRIAARRRRRDGAARTDEHRRVGRRDRSPRAGAGRLGVGAPERHERAAATLYTSCESCAMCAGGQYWAGHRPPGVRPLRRAARRPRGRRHAQPPPVEPRGLLARRRVTSTSKVRVTNSPPRRSPCSTATGPSVTRSRPRRRSFSSIADQRRSGIIVTPASANGRSSSRRPSTSLPEPRRSR